MLSISSLRSSKNLMLINPKGKMYHCINHNFIPNNDEENGSLLP